MALPSTGGTVYIPASGNGDAYVVATSVNPAKPIVLACDSPSTTILWMAPKSPAGFLMLAPSSDFTITSCTIDGNQAHQPGDTPYSQATVKWTGTGYFQATGNVFQNGGGENIYLGDVSSQICPKEIQVNHNKFLNLIGHGGLSGQNSAGVFIVCTSAQTGISSSIEIHFNKFLQSTPALNGTFSILVAGNPPVSPPGTINLRRVSRTMRLTDAVTTTTWEIPEPVSTFITMPEEPRLPITASSTSSMRRSRSRTRQ